MSDQANLRLPIKLDSTSNGEFVPIPLEPANRFANQLAHETADNNAHRLGCSRRDFLMSACGAASTLLAFNTARAADGASGGFFNLPPEAAMEDAAARDVLAGDEFIFDVQGHFVNPEGAWLQGLPEDAKPLSMMPQASCTLGQGGAPRAYLKCLGPETFVKDVFMDSDTDLMVLSFVPSTREGEPLKIEEAAAVRDIVDNLEGSQRLFLHGRVNPNQAGDIEDMPRLKEDFGICAWKTYTQWGPEGTGYFLSDEDTGIRFLETAQGLDVPIICIHKGIPFGPQSYEHSLCDDIGVVARRFPNLSFLIYHSGFVPGKSEGPYNPERNEGVDSLIKTVSENNLGHGSNVYAELGSTWRFLMRDPDSAAHTLGKLMKYLGEDNILWGTDSIWYGSPQDQIQAFRTFEISESFQEQYGYPALTRERKRKILGLNALRPYALNLDEVRTHVSGDHLARKKRDYLENPSPHFRTFGPRNRREFLNLLRWGGEYQT